MKKTIIFGLTIFCIFFFLLLVGINIFNPANKNYEQEYVLGGSDTIAVDATSSKTIFATTGNVATWAHTVSGSNRALVVGFACGNGTVQGCSYNGTPMTKYAEVPSDNGNFDDGALFVLVAPDTGTHNIVCSSTQNWYLIGTGVSYTGVSQTDPVGDVATSSSVGNVGSLAIDFSTEEDNSWLSGYLYVHGSVGGAFTAGTNTTIRYAQANWQTSFDSNGAQSPTGSYSLNINSGTSAELRMMGVELKPSDAGVSSNNPPTISSVSDTPDPVLVSSSTTFSVDWNDADTEGIKMYICKTDSISTTSPGCGGDTWCSSTTEFSLVDPITCQYTASTTDIGSNDYYAFVCDDEVSCSTSTSGTFEATTTVAVTGTVTLTDISNKLVYQRGLDNEYDLTVSGTYTGNPSTIEAKVIASSTGATVIDWTTVDSSLSEGTFSGTLPNIPDGGWYNLQVRFGENTSITDEGTNDWGVGIIVATYGQSNMAFGWFYPDKGGSTLTPTSTISYYSEEGLNTPGSDAYGTFSIADGGVEFGNTLIETLDVPIMLLDYANPGAAITGLVSGQASYTALSNGVTAVGGSVEYFLYIQGESDGDANMAEATYEGHLTSLSNSVQGDFSRSGETLPFIIGVIGRRTSASTSDSGWTNIRNADKDVAAASSTIYIGSWNVDIPLTDGIHYTSAGNISVADRMANTVLYLEGESSCYESPIISSFEEVNNQTVDIRITHNCGSNFTPTSNITGFRVLDGGSPETITSATQIDSTKIRLSISGTITGELSVDYQWGQAPDITGVVNDNSTLTLPLAFSTEISEYVPVSYPTIIIK